ncbi:MAG: hypothetical protein AUJ11_02250 [Parcubacteria group bacterium CG1_02_44_65]|nr:MAG: hypothetical protein AUJ11_02250 [Parcubacteria group bacterium CG1_02_44_65]
MTNKVKNSHNNILVCGSLAYDRIMDFPGRFSDHILPGKTRILNVSFALNGVKESFGGTAGNIAYNLALLGEQPKVIGVAGSDFGKYKKWLKKNKINLERVKIASDCPTACAYIMTDKADNQITAFYGGPMDKIPLTPFDKGGKMALAIVAPDVVARMAEYVKIFKRTKIPYIFDPGQATTSLSARQLKWAVDGAKALIGNDYEIQLILNKLKINFSRLEKLVEILVITKGGAGSEVYFKGKKLKIPPAKPKSDLDPTGAGDAYRAGFIKGLVNGWPLEKCGRLAAVTAVYTVEKYGTQTHKFTWKELGERYRKNFNDKL